MARDRDANVSIRAEIDARGIELRDPRPAAPVCGSVCFDRIAAPPQSQPVGLDAAAVDLALVLSARRRAERLRPALRSPLQRGLPVGRPAEHYVLRIGVQRLSDHESSLREGIGAFEFRVAHRHVEVARQRLVVEVERVYLVPDVRAAALDSDDSCRRSRSAR
ncbi:hypothetical protein ACFFQF_27960 [Haladaptatus pallidirubidus]|uniref:hypothetical protein n=1 Tax=Haladaptatus pallidirubidus TaxID=1008152 RepID=UPI001D1303FB|nr:hypothetical protein [Haladaptatus pallidirubidus]